MLVLFVSGEFPPMQGGVGDCTFEIAQGLARLGVQVHVLTTGSAVDRSPVEQPSAGDSRECPVEVHRLVGKWNWSCLRLITVVAGDLAPSIVHIQFQTGAYGMHPAINFLPRYMRPRLGGDGGPRQKSNEARPRVVTTFHDLKVPYLFPKAGPFREWVVRSLARSSDAAIATNAQDYNRLASWQVARLALLPIGSNISPKPPPEYDRDAWRARFGIGRKMTLLSYFGFLNESKGGETLIRALAQIPRSKLMIVGGQVGSSDPTNIAYLKRVKELIQALGLVTRVLWTDYMSGSEVSACLLSSDICVLPYRDGASFRRGSFMAALAHGLPIVTTFPPTSTSHSSITRTSVQLDQDRQVGPLLPILRNGENVMLVPPDDPEALAGAISQLATSPGLRQDLSRGAQELAAFFTWDKIAQQHLDFYRLLIDS